MWIIIPQLCKQRSEILLCFSSLCDQFERFIFCRIVAQSCYKNLGDLLPGDNTIFGLLGICGGGGYSLATAETDKRFKSIATISMFNSGLVRRNGMQDSQLDTIQQRLKQASDARAQEVAGSEVLYSGDANLTDEQIAKLPFALYRQGYEYYWKTHAHPNIFRSVRDIVPSKRWLL